MKKLLFLLLSLAIIVTGCSEDNESTDSNNDTDEAEKVEAEGEAQEEGQELGVEKGIFNVELTIPSTFFESENIDEVIAEAKEDGVSEVSKNEDGSLTYKMTKSKHKEMLKEMEDELNKNVEEMVTSEDYASIEDITHNQSFSKFSMIVKRNEFEDSFDGLTIFALGVSGMFYQAFEGVNADEYEVVIDVQDAETGEIFNSVVYPDALDETQE